MLSIEGRIRDLALAEVFQLLARGRKTGTLHCEAPLLSREARIGFMQGAIVDADVADVGRLAGARTDDVLGGRQVEEAALDVLCWKDGTFRFFPGETPTPRVRRAVATRSVFFSMSRKITTRRGRSTRSSDLPRSDGASGIISGRARSLSMP